MFCRQFFYGTLRMIIVLDLKYHECVARVLSYTANIKNLFQVTWTRIVFIEQLTE